MRSILVVLAACSALFLGACAQIPPGMGGVYQSSATTYVPAQAQQVQQVSMGTVIAVLPVTIQAPQGQQAVGSTLGAVVGGYAGDQVGNGRGSTAMALLGAVAGAMAGNAVSQRAYGQPGLQITVRLDPVNKWQGAQTIAVTQAADVQVRPGQRVEVLNASQYGYGQQPARVIPIN